MESKFKVGDFVSQQLRNGDYRMAAITKVVFVERRNKIGYHTRYFAEFNSQKHPHINYHFGVYGDEAWEEDLLLIDMLDYPTEKQFLEFVEKARKFRLDDYDKTALRNLRDVSVLYYESVSTEDFYMALIRASFALIETEHPSVAYLIEKHHYGSGEPYSEVLAVVPDQRTAYLMTSEQNNGPYNYVPGSYDSEDDFKPYVTYRAVLSFGFAQYA